MKRKGEQGIGFMRGLQLAICALVLVSLVSVSLGGNQTPQSGTQTSGPPAPQTSSSTQMPTAPRSTGQTSPPSAPTATVQTGTASRSQGNAAVSSVSPLTMDQRIEFMERQLKIVSDQMERQVKILSDQVSWILLPLTILIGILALGGALGVVFSFREQSRTSQIHELTVAGEQAAQRRTEDSYATFIDASQKTLTLVNETLQLAKEASERANQTMTLRAERSLNAIAEQAQDLLEKALHGDFKSIVIQPALRTSLEGLAKELAAIEGYLSLQAIPLRPECVFVQAMSRHLSNDARGAIRLLRDVAREGIARDLRCLAQYWIGYLHNNRGNYAEAAQEFRGAQDLVATGDSRLVELQRITWETEFFLAAQKCSKDKDNVQETADREAAVKDPLAELAKLASKVRGITRYEKASQGIASTRANILTWIADVKNGSTLNERRRGCLSEAKELYSAAGGGMFARFGFNESEYYLTEQANLIEYSKIEREAMEFLQSRREPRNTANIYETILIARCRLRSKESGNSWVEIYRNVQDAIGEILDEEITIFSQFEKRNLIREDFVREVNWIYEKMAKA